MVHIQPNVEQPLRQRIHSSKKYDVEETKEQGVPLNETTSSSDDQIQQPPPPLPNKNKYFDLYKDYLRPVLSAEEQSRVH